MGCGGSKNDESAKRKESNEGESVVPSAQPSSADPDQTKRTRSKVNRIADNAADDFDGEDNAKNPLAGDPDYVAAGGSKHSKRPSRELQAFTFGETAADEYGGGQDQPFNAFHEEHASGSESDSGTPTHKGAAAVLRVRAGGVSDETITESDEKNWVPPVHAKSQQQKDMLRGILRPNPLFGSLEDKDLETVVDAMELKTFKQGTEILTQGGDGGEHYFVISRGIVDIIKNGSFICSFTEGQGFGEMELMYIQPCVATVRAQRDVETWALERRAYKRLVMRIAIQRRALYQELLGGVEFLERMTEYEKGVLADALSPATYPPGSYIIRRGERNEWMHIIVEGVVEVFGVDDEDESRRKFICTLERGVCVGELEFLNQHPAVADCVAKTQVRTTKLHRDHFEMCMGPIMDVLRKTVRQEKYAYYNEQLDDFHHHNQQQQQGTQRQGSAPAARGRRGRAKAVSAEADDDHDDASFVPPVVAKDEATIHHLRAVLKKSALFSALSPADREVVIGALRPQTFPKGTEIYTQDELRDDGEWHIVDEGSVDVLVDGKKVASFASGQTFGEVELMYATPAAATTVVTSTALKVFSLDRTTYRRIVMRVSKERRAQYRELLSGVAFLQAMSDPEQLALADALSPCHFIPGDYIVRIGAQNEWMYIIADGVVEVIGKDGEKVCDLRRGEMVGELEFLNKHLAVADCIAKTHVQAVRLHRDHFELCLGPVHGFIESLLSQPKYSYYNQRRVSMQAGSIA